jgi:hypothetical protein
MKTSNPCFVNFANHFGWYQRGQGRLRKSIVEHAPETPFVGLSSFEHIDSPTHAEVNYAFKPLAMFQAYRQGFDGLVWLDASCWLRKAPAGILEKVNTDGHLFFYNCSAGTWTSDVCLGHFGLTRDEAMQIPMIQACIMGLNLNYPPAVELLNRLAGKARAHPEIFHGDWSNDRGTISKDPRCRGHRHDQSVASILIHQINREYDAPVLKIQHQRGPVAEGVNYFEYTDSLLFEYDREGTDAEIVAAGM